MLVAPNVGRQTVQALLSAGRSYFKGDLNGLLTAGTTAYKTIGKLQK
jgi:hypothetical protein